MSISESDLECYRQSKPKLIEQLRHGKVFDRVAQEGLVGLLNQGATCYLNALLKMLYSINSFRVALFQNTSDSPIIIALQKLFAQLSSSAQYAVSTKELTSAFGWNNADVFEQHDALELFSVLLDAVGKEGSDPDALSKMFKGVENGTLRCPSCGNVAITETTFLDISLNLNSLNPIASPSKKDLFRMIQENLADEILGVDDCWKCSKCSNKVQANKSIEYKSIPPVLMFNIKRIGFDATTARRRKITDPVYFPLILKASELQKANDIEKEDNTKFYLTAVLLHNGSAMGGHYRAITRDPQTSQWREHNDADVRIISKEEETNIFWYQSNGRAEPSPTSTAFATGENGPNDSLYTGVYALLYQREDLVNQGSQTIEIPPHVEEAIAVDNAELEKLRTAFVVYNKMTNFHVSCVGVDAELSPVVQVELPADLSLRDATSSVYEAVISARAGNNLLPTLPSSSLCRLRRYERSCRHLGETFGSRDLESLGTLSLGVDRNAAGNLVRIPEGCSVALEFRKEDEAFVEFTGKEMQLKVVRWIINSTGALEEADSHVVVVPGEDASTLEALRSVAISSFAFSGSSDQILLMKDTDRGPIVLTGDSKNLRKDFRLFSGAEVIVEFLPEGQNRVEVETGDVQSPVYSALINKQQMIQVFYNVPVAAGVAPEYTLSMEMQCTATLKEFKDKASAILQLTDFHIRRSATGVQMKNEKKTMEELGITTQSIIHLQLGAGCLPGEHVIRFEVDVTVASGDLNAAAEESTFVLLGEIPVKERSSVLHTKEKIFSSWNELISGKSGIPYPLSAQHIRIRDGKVGSQSGPLRDERAIGKCLLGMSDGRRIIVQVLPFAEVIGPEDYLLFVRLASYEKKTLSRPLDLIVPKKSTIAQLCDKIRQQYPACIESPEVTSPCPIGIAKAFSTGPALSLKSALKLKWTDDADAKPVDVETVTIDQPPLSIRDGATVVVRDQAGYLRAKEIARLKKETAAENGDGSAVGDESPMRGTLRPGTRGSRLRPSTQSRKLEQGVKIMSASSSQPMLPPSGKTNYDTPSAPEIPCASPGKDGAVLSLNFNEGETPGELPNAPVRVVKALRGDSIDDA